jgi:hypothetical protein
MQGITASRQLAVFAIVSRCLSLFEAKQLTIN